MNNNLANIFLECARSQWARTVFPNCFTTGGLANKKKKLLIFPIPDISVSTQHETYVDTSVYPNHIWHSK